MNKANAKALLLLAASDLDAEHLKSFAELVKRLGPVNLVSMIDRLRDIAADGTMGFQDAETTSHVEAANHLRRSAAVQIERLLINEARLTRSTAAKLLIAEIGRETGALRIRPEAMKSGGFRNWLEQLIDESSPSAALHVATAIRNRLVHGVKSDWPLKKDAK